MSFITSGLPGFIQIAGVLVPINTDYRKYIQFETAFFDNNLLPEDKIAILFENALGNQNVLPTNEVIEILLLFYRCGEPVLHKRSTQKRNSDLPYCFEADAARIFSAFLHDYNINLTKVNLHWWEFRALFNSLSEQTEFVKILQYRCVEITGDMSKKQQDFYRRMKIKYALPQNLNGRDKREIEKEMIQRSKKAREEALNNGRNQ